MGQRGKEGREINKLYLEFVLYNVVTKAMRPSDCSTGICFKGILMPFGLPVVPEE